MNGKWMLMLMVCVLSLSLFPASSEAVSGLTVTINGSQINGTQGCSNPTPNSVILSDCNGNGVSYGAFTIWGLGGNRAQVVAVDGNEDQIYLENAKIIANSDCSNSTSGCGDIAFWATFSAPPTATTVNVTFTRSTSNGQILRTTTTAATTDWFKIDSWVQDGTGPLTEVWGWDKKTVTCVTPVSTCAPFGFPSRSQDWTPPQLTADRQMKMEFWFYQQKANDWIQFNNVQLATTGGGGGPRPDSIKGDGTSHGVEGGCPPCLIRTMPSFGDRLKFWLFKTVPPQPPIVPPGPGPDPTKGGTEKK